VKGILNSRAALQGLLIDPDRTSGCSRRSDRAEQRNPGRSAVAGSYVTRPWQQRCRRSYQQAVAAGDLDSARQVFHPDVTYAVAGDSALTGTYRGPDAVMGYLGRLMELTRGTYTISRMRWVTSPDRVGLLTLNHAERDGKRLSWDELIVFEFVDGLKKRISHFSGDQQSLDELLPR